MKMVKINDRVSCKSFQVSGTGTVTYIDEPNLYNHYFSPIQVELDEPYEEGEQTTFRFSLKEIEII